MNKIYIGIDNGVTGSIACIYPDGSINFEKIPTKKELSYTKKKQYITRVDFQIMYDKLSNLARFSNDFNYGIFCIIERPMLNPGRFKASVSALRCLEATLICLEENEIPFQYIDSKEWQRVMLPSGCKKEELKKASMDIACRLFPHLAIDIKKHKDGDSLLMAEYVKRKKL
jgi:hypothetical protein